MSDISNNIMFLSSRIETHLDHLVEEEPVSVVATLSDIICKESDVVEQVASNLRFALLDAGEDYKEPSTKLIAENVKGVLENEGFEVKQTGLGLVATRNEETIEVTASSLVRGKELYKETLKFKKVAAILPDMNFVKGLASQAFEVLVKVKPKDVSKCLAGIIHTMFFDYAMDKNIFLTSSFYHELRKNHLKDIKAELGVDEIKYYASSPEEKKLAKIINSGLKSNAHLKLYKQAKKQCSNLSDRNLCDRLLVMSELLGFDDEKVMSLASSLSKITKLEFNFAEV